jgi:hypothetical protein
MRINNILHQVGDQTEVITLRVSDGLSIHHQESKTVHTSSDKHHTVSFTACYRAQDEFHLVPASKQLQNTCDIYLKLYIQSWTPDDGRRDRPKHVERFLISNFRRVLYVVCFLLGNSPSSEFYMPTFRNTLSVPSSQASR